MFFGSSGSGFFSIGAAADLSGAAGLVATIGGGAWLLDGFSSDGLAGELVLACRFAAQEKATAIKRRVFIDFILNLSIHRLVKGERALRPAVPKPSASR